MPTDEESVQLMVPQHSQENGRKVSYGLSPHQNGNGSMGGINFQSDNMGLLRSVCIHLDSIPNVSNLMFIISLL
jgi:hypothetical protein